MPACRYKHVEALSNPALPIHAWLHYQYEPVGGEGGGLDCANLKLVPTTFLTFQRPYDYDAAANIGWGELDPFHHHRHQG